MSVFTDIKFLDQNVAGVRKSCTNVPLGASFHIAVKLDMVRYASVFEKHTETFDQLKDCTNCCWAHVLFEVMLAHGRTVTDMEAGEIFWAIKNADSSITEITCLEDVITRMKLPVTFVEYSVYQKAGTVVGEINGPAVFACLSNGHFTVKLPVNSPLEPLFNGIKTTAREAQDDSKAREAQDARKVAAREARDARKVAARDAQDALIAREAQDARKVAAHKAQNAHKVAAREARDARKVAARDAQDARDARFARKVAARDAQDARFARKVAARDAQDALIAREAQNARKVTARDAQNARDARFARKVAAREVAIASQIESDAEFASQIVV
jgi:hypothetical protein